MKPRKKWWKTVSGTWESGSDKHGAMVIPGLTIHSWTAWSQLSGGLIKKGRGNESSVVLAELQAEAWLAANPPERIEKKDRAAAIEDALSFLFRHWVATKNRASLPSGLAQAIENCAVFARTRKDKG